jgi:hypothetical protein
VREAVLHTGEGNGCVTNGRALNGVRRSPRRVWTRAQTCIAVIGETSAPNRQRRFSGVLISAAFADSFTVLHHG